MRKTSLRDRLVGKIPDEYLDQVNRSFEIVGDIAITEIPDELDKFDVKIAKAILEANSRIKTVLKKSGIHEGEFRTQKLEYVFGEEKKETLYTENGIQLEINPETVYFSAKLSTERQDLMEKLKPNKKVLVMFSGAGPYTFVGLRKQPNMKRITSVEINPEGHKYAQRNLHHNKNLLKKSELYKQLLEFLRSNNLPIIEKLLISNLNKLKIEFINADVRRVTDRFSLRKYEEEIDEYDNELFQTPQETFDNLKNHSLPILYLDLDAMNFEQLIPFFVMFSQQFTFVCSYEEEKYIFETDFEKGYLLNILEGESGQSVTLYDQIFMPLPKDAYDFLDVALKVADKGCIIHMYDFIHESNFPKESEDKVLSAARIAQREVKILETRKVGQYSPRKYRVCCDFVVN